MFKRLTTAFLALIVLFSILSMPALAAKNGWLDDSEISEEETEQSEDIRTLTREDEEAEEEEEKEDKKSTPQIVFTDVPADAWYYDVVMDLADAGIIGGFGDGTFRPAVTVTTGQALKMILLAAGYEEPERVDSHWARCFLNLALEEKILERGEITDLDINMSRRLVAKVAAIALDVARTDDEQAFTDTDDDYVHALYEIGIIGGYEDGTFRPDKALTRAELSAIAHRIYAYLEDLNKKDKDKDKDEDDLDLDGEAPELRTTEDAIEYLKNVEGFCKEPYWDYQQYSIGYGSRCDPDDYPDGITKKEAEILLRNIVYEFEQDLDAFIKKHKIKLDDNEYDALVLFTYNVGSTWMRSSRLSDLLIDGDYDENDFASAYGVWCHVGSSEPEISSALVKRRIRELQIFFDADYTGKKSDGFCVLYYVSDIGEVSTDIGFYREGTQYDPLYDAYSDDGEEFLGWETEDGYMITEDDVAEEDLTVYAVWDY